MTRKDYTKFADMLQGLRKAQFDEQIVSVVVDEISFIFAEDNPRFDRERFLKACELNCTEAI